MPSTPDPRRPRHLPRIAALAVAGLCLLLTGCGGNGDTDEPAANVTGVEAPAASTTSPPSAPVEGPFTPTAQGPRIEFEKLEHDFGKISDTERHATSYRFRNVGSERLVIHDVKAACGCTVPNRRQFSVGPGERDQIDIIFDPKGKQYKTDKYITVVSNCTVEPTLKLSLTSDIQPLLGFERMHNLGTVRLGEGKLDVVQLSHTDPNLEFTEVTSNNPNVGVRIVESGVAESDGDSVKYRAGLEISVRPDAPWGLLYATRAHMKVRGKPWPDAEPVVYEYDMYLIGNVYGMVHAQQGIISLGNVTSGTPIRGSTQITRVDAQPMAVGNARITESTMPGLEATIQSVSANTCRVSVTGMASNRGSVKGAVTIETDVPGEEELTIRFAGQVK
ncbi:MAG: DUF1573 domain-containing protein [Planctomycetes bacterium]|nr:DUF1573 domain-containing protein [Planctomycetota bacterium]